MQIATHVAKHVTQQLIQQLIFVFSYYVHNLSFSTINYLIVIIYCHCYYRANLCHSNYH